jgi:DNA-binding response OmpR family regulator
MKKTIILIEDTESIGGMIKSLLEHRDYDVIWLQTFDEAFDFLDNFSVLETAPVALIIFDYMLDKHNSDVTSIPLVEMMRDMGYLKPMIANSTDEDFNKRLLEAGCTHIRPNSGKIHVVDFLHRDIFGNN